MNDFETVEMRLNPPFASVMLNRPAVRNAMNQQMIADLQAAFELLADSARVRAVVMHGADGTFCAGGDLKEMQHMFGAPAEQQAAYTRAFDRLLQTVNRAPQVVIARVDGAAMGGGLGLVCISDIAIASTETVFALSEVRLGIIPALISPYVMQRIGLTAARRLMLTGDRFEADAALRYGIVHEVYPPEELDEHLNDLLGDIRECSPAALEACKQLLFAVLDQPVEATTDLRARMLSESHASADGQEGMLAFIQKRRPRWALTDR
jgi:isohexenylglutaconyl-CoA hydratase